MKVSIFLATYEKNECLSNTLYSISRQKTTFPLEVCIVDDCSTVDPEPIVREFLPDAKYVRLEKHVGTQFSQSLCFQFMSPDTDIVIVQSVDVMYLGLNVLEEMCRLIELGKFVMPGVRNVMVPTDAYKDSGYDFSDGYENAVGYDIYQGVDRPSKDWLLFLSALTKDDLVEIDFPNRCCDVCIQHKIKEVGLEPIFVKSVKGIHQKHPPAHMHPCSIVDSCEIWCARKVV